MLIGTLSFLAIKSAENLITRWREGRNRKSERLIEIREPRGQWLKYVAGT